MNPAIINTSQAIAAVYDWLGRPDKMKLLPTIVCTKYWSQLDYVQQVLNISDRTLYLNQVEETVATGQREKELGEVVSFGTPIGLEIVERSGSIESTRPVPLISDARQLASVPEFCAVLYRDDESGNLTLRFNRPLEATARFRLWYDPSGYGRPGLQENSFLPPQAINYVVIETADACTPDLLRIFPGEVSRGYAQNIEKQVAKFKAVFLNWAMKDPGAGVKHRRAFNETRRGGNHGGRPPIIGDVG